VEEGELGRRAVEEGARAAGSGGGRRQRRGREENEERENDAGWNGTTNFG
jgi:hypothetical protein